MTWEPRRFAATQSRELSRCRGVDLKWWVLAILIFFGLLAWCWLNLTPAARHRKAMFNRRDRKPVMRRDLALTSRGTSAEKPRTTPPPPKTAAEYLDVG